MYAHDTYRAARISSREGWPAISLAQMPYAQLRGREIGVDIRAAALNHLDLDIAAGTSRYDVDLPIVPGLEGAGIVSRLGSEVQDVSIGDRVIIVSDIVCGECRFCSDGRDNLCIGRAYRPGLNCDGTLAEHIVLPEWGVQRLGENVSFEMAAALQISYGAACHMISDRATLSAGEWVLISGAAGGVGHATWQLAGQVGARAICGSASAVRRERLRAEGAEYVIDYSDSNFVAEVMEITAGDGVDLVVDHVGGTMLSSLIDCLTVGGRLVFCGAHGGEWPQVDMVSLFRREISLIGSNSATQRNVSYLLGLCENKSLRPEIGHVFPLEDVRMGYDLMSKRRHFGKVVISI